MLTSIAMVKNIASCDDNIAWLHVDCEWSAIKGPKLKTLYYKL